MYIDRSVEDKTPRIDIKDQESKTGQLRQQRFDLINKSSSG